MTLLPLSLFDPVAFTGGVRRRPRHQRGLLAEGQAGSCAGREGRRSGRGGNCGGGRSGRRRPLGDGSGDAGHRRGRGWAAGGGAGTCSHSRQEEAWAKAQARASKGQEAESEQEGPGSSSGSKTAAWRCCTRRAEKLMIMQWLRGVRLKKSSDTEILRIKSLTMRTPSVASRSSLCLKRKIGAAIRGRFTSSRRRQQQITCQFAGSGNMVKSIFQALPESLLQERKVRRSTVSMRFLGKKGFSLI